MFATALAATALVVIFSGQGIVSRAAQREGQPNMFRTRFVGAHREPGPQDVFWVHAPKDGFTLLTAINVGSGKAEAITPDLGESLGTIAVASDATGTVYVYPCIDYQQGPHCISVFTHKNSHQFRIIRHGVRDVTNMVAHGKELYVASDPQDSIVVYKNLGATIVRTISDGIGNPASLAFDSEDNLYVANKSRDSITVYPPGATEPSRTITDGVGNPQEIAIDGADTLYVLNGNGLVTEYSPGTSYPERHVGIGCRRLCSMAVARDGTLYLAPYGKYFSSVAVFPPGEQHPKNAFDLDGLEPGQLLADSDGELLVADGFGSATYVERYVRGRYDKAVWSYGGINGGPITLGRAW